MSEQVYILMALDNKNSVTVYAVYKSMKSALQAIEACREWKPDNQYWITESRISQ